MNNAICKATQKAGVQMVPRSGRPECCGIDCTGTLDDYRASISAFSGSIADSCCCNCSSESTDDIARNAA